MTFKTLIILILIVLVIATIAQLMKSKAKYRPMSKAQPHENDVGRGRTKIKRKLGMEELDLAAAQRTIDRTDRDMQETSSSRRNRF